MRLDRSQKRLDPLAGHGRNGDGRTPRFGAFGEQPRAVGLVEQVDLVPHFDDTLGIMGVDAEIGENALDVLGLRRRVGIGDVAQMQHEVGLDHFFQRRPESGDQMGGKIGDETDRVGQDDRRAVRQAKTPQRRVERGEQHVLRQHPCPRQPVEQGGLAGIGVADDGDYRKRHLLALGAMQVACAPHRLQLALQLDDLVLQDTAVGLDLRLAGAAEETGATALALQVGPAPHQPALLVVQMRKLDLQRAFLGARPLPEYLEDQPGPVENLGVELLLQVALLDRRQGMIDDGELGMALLHDLRQFSHLAGTQQRRRSRIVHLDDRDMDGVERNGARQPDRLVAAGLGRTSGILAPRIILRTRQDRHDDDRARRGRRVFRPYGRLAADSAVRVFTGGQLALAFLGIEHLHGLARHDGRNGMLIDELRMAVAPQQHAEIVERGHHPGQFHAVDEEDRQWVLALANRIQEQILKVLRTLRHSSYLSPIPVPCLTNAPK